MLHIFLSRSCCSIYPVKITRSKAVLGLPGEDKPECMSWSDMNNPVVVQQQTVILTEEGREDARELVAVEQPYRVALNDREIGSSMVLATGLEEFGAGFLFGQGYIDHPGQVREVLVCPEGRIEVHADVEEDFAPKEVIITSGCGGTGKISREMLEGRIVPLQEYSLGFAEAGEFIRQVLLASDLGQKTHCVHGCGLWAEGRMQVFFEDIGRHNAVDKLIGKAFLAGMAMDDKILLSSGRISGEIMTKVVRNRIPVLGSRTAPTCMSITTAADHGVTLIAFARGGRMNIYTHPCNIRIMADSPHAGSGEECSLPRQGDARQMEPLPAAVAREALL